MPDVESPEHGIARLSVRCLTHRKEFLGEIRHIYSGFQKLYRIELD